MNADLSPNTCPQCAAPLPPEAPHGLCPKCLLAGVAAATESGARPEAPALAEIAAAFPQLEVQALIGAGGMGAVYRARQPQLERLVALKVLPAALAGRDSAFAERFMREGRLLARLSHPNIVSVHDFGQAGAFYYLVMEYVDGVNLREAMQAGRFTPEQALGLVPRICEALQYAHDEGVLHRDIKPENILLDAKGRVKLADFGIAKLAGENAARTAITATGATLGTPAYMAPEQIEQPAAVDHRADIYSLGVVFYEMLTGELPLGRFAAPSAKTPMDARIDDIVLRALAKEREQRQQSATEMKTQVEHLAAAPPVAARRWSRRKIALVIAGLALPLALIVVALTAPKVQAFGGGPALMVMPALILLAVVFLGALFFQALWSWLQRLGTPRWLAVSVLILTMLSVPIGGCAVMLVVPYWAMARSAPPPESRPRAEVVLTLQGDGRVVFGGETFAPEKTAEILARSALDPTALVIVRAARTAPYAALQTTLDGLRAAGCANVKIKTIEAAELEPGTPLR